MEKENRLKLSSIQLFCLVMLFNIGSSTLYPRGLEAKQDAWIAVLLAVGWTALEILIFYALYKAYPNKNLAEIITALLGKWVGAPLIVIFLMYFNSIFVFNLHEFSQLMLLTFLPKTPILVVQIVFLLVEAFIVFLGIQILGRMGELFVGLVIFSLFAVFILIIFSGQVDFKNLQPVFSKGFGPIFQGSFNTLEFPFGETIVFMMYFKFVDKKEKILKATLLGLGVSGLIVLLSTVIIISVLGINYAGIAQVPLLKVIKLINIGDILTNLDALGIMIITLGGLFKMTVYLYAIVMGISTLLKIKKVKWLIPAVSILDLILIGVWFINFPFYIAVALDMQIKHIQYYYQIVLPPLLLILHWVKNLNKKEKSEKKKIKLKAPCPDT